MRRAKENFADYREAMVREQIVRRDIRCDRTIDAFRNVPRHNFVPQEYQHLAYTDGPVRIGEGQTISQPYIVALMTEMLQLQEHYSVLEVGTGSGYQAAILAQLVRKVYSIERHQSLAEEASSRLSELGYHNFEIHTGDGTLGLPQFAPYDAIIVTAAAPKTPRALLLQLDDGGRLVLPVGGRYSQILECWQRNGDDFSKEGYTPVAFVPLIGELGWDDKKWGDAGLWRRGV